MEFKFDLQIQKIAMKKIISGLFVMLIYSQVSAQPSQNSYNSTKTITVLPVTMSFNLKNGESGFQKISIKNQLDAKKQFKVYLNDWERDTVGQHVYTEPGSDSNSCANWVSFDKSFFELEPNQSEVINVKLQLPDSINGPEQMRWCMLFIETVQENKMTNDKGLTTSIESKIRFGIHIYQTPPAITFSEVHLLDFTNLAEIKKLRITCKNTGKTQIECNSYLEIVSISDGTKLKLPKQEFPMFPNQVRYVDFNLPEELQKGKYIITGVVDGGEELPLEVAQLTIEIK